MARLRKAFFGGGMDFNNASCAGQHEIRICFGVQIFRVIKIQNRHALIDAAGDGGNMVG